MHHQYFAAAISIVFVLLSTRLGIAQDRLNFAYISPNAGSSSVLWVAKDAGIFKKMDLT